MKRLFTITVLFLTFGTGTLFAQSLLLTEWEVYEFEGAEPAYLFFGTDVLSASEDGSEFYQIAYFSSTDTELWLHDITSENGCNPSDTGRYTYEIINDTLHFTLVVDSCDVRQETFIESFWVQTALGVDDLNPLKSVDLFPNPAQDQFTIMLNSHEDLSVQLIDFSGRVVYENSFFQREVKIDISDLSLGIYFVQLKQGKFIETRRLIKSN